MLKVCAVIMWLLLHPSTLISNRSTFVNNKYWLIFYELGAETPLYLALLPAGSTDIKGEFLSDKKVIH